MREEFQSADVFLRNGWQTRVVAVLDPAPSGIAKTLDTNAFEVLDARLREGSVRAEENDKSGPPILLRIVVLDTFAKTIRLTDVDTRGTAGLILRDEEVEARPVEFLALKRLIESASRGAESTAAPLIDFRDAGTRWLIVVE